MKHKYINSAVLLAIVLFAFGLAVILFSGCTHSNRISKGQMMLTREYIGEYISYQYRAPEKWTEPHLCWIKTTQGEILVYAKKVEFTEGEWLYINRINSPIPGNCGSIAVKHIESSDSGYYYKLIR